VQVTFLYIYPQINQDRQRVRVKSITPRFSLIGKCGYTDYLSGLFNATHIVEFDNGWVCLVPHHDLELLYDQPSNKEQS
jgi:hypothetical protein